MTWHLCTLLTLYLAGCFSLTSYALHCAAERELTDLDQRLNALNEEVNSICRQWGAK